MKKYRVAVLTSHPIQYQVPLFQRLGKTPDLDLTVYYCWDFGVKKTGYDKEFGKRIQWDIPILEGYAFQFLRNYSFVPANGFLGLINFGIVGELMRNRYDAVIIFGWNAFTNCLAVFVARMWGIKVLMRGENPLNQELMKPRNKLELKKTVLGTFFKLIGAFLYIGEENRRFYEYYGVPGGKLIFAPYAVENDRLFAAA